MKQKGITLIALTITIIVMLILAGITINLVVGEDGIIKKALGAGESYKKAQANEQKDLDDLYSEILVATNENAKITISVQELNQLIKDKVKEVATQLVASPDYANPQQLTFTNQSYTVENDGFIQFYFNYNTYLTDPKGVNDDITINGTQVFRNSSDNTWQNARSPIFPVKKGDTIQYTKTAHEVTVYYYSIRY